MKKDSDSHGVWIETWVIDLVDGDFAAALLLSQLLYWHQPAKTGRSRLTTSKDGELWLFRGDDEWEDDCRLTVRQVRRIRTHLKSRGLIEHRVFRVAGGTTVSAWRPVYPIIQEACDAAEVGSRLASNPGPGVTRSRHSEKKSGVTRWSQLGVTPTRHSIPYWKTLTLNLYPPYPPHSGGIPHHNQPRNPHPGRREPARDRPAPTLEGPGHPPSPTRNWPSSPARTATPADAPA